MSMVIHASRIRRSRRGRSKNPREGIVGKPGWGFMIIGAIGAFGVAALAAVTMLVMAASSSRSPSRTVSVLVEGSSHPSVVAEDDSTRLRRAVAILDRCPDLRPMVRRMTTDGVLDRDEFTRLVSGAKSSGCGTKG